MGRNNGLLMDDHADQSVAGSTSGTAALGPDELALPFAGGWEAHQHRHCIWLVSAEGEEDQQPLEPLAKALEQAFTKLGGSAPMVRARSEWNGRAPLVLGAHLLSLAESRSLPRGTIVYNVHRPDLGSASFGVEYRSLLNRHPVLGCSRNNRDALHRAGIKHAGLLEIGYSEVLSRIRPDRLKDIDVLHSGAGNHRASALLTHLAERGANVAGLARTSLARRDELLARAKIVLSLRDGEAGMVELVELHELLANGLCVVREGKPSDPDVQPLSGGLELVPYDELADRCLELLDQPARREKLARTGLERITRRQQSRLLQNSILEGATPMDPATTQIAEAEKNLATGIVYQPGRILVDGMVFVNCTFAGTTLVYEGGQVPVFDNCNMSGVAFDFAGAAGNTFQFLKMLLDQKIISGI